MCFWGWWGMMMSWGYTQMVNSGFMKQEKREWGKSKPSNMRKWLFLKSIFSLFDISRPNLLGYVLYHELALKYLLVHLKLIPSNYLNSFAAWNQGSKCCELGKAFQERRVQSDCSKFWISLLPAFHPIARNQTTQIPKPRSCWRSQGSELQQCPANCSGQCKNENSFHLWITRGFHIGIIIYNEISQAGYLTVRLQDYLNKVQT